MTGGVQYQKSVSHGPCLASINAFPFASVHSSHEPYDILIFSWQRSPPIIHETARVCFLWTLHQPYYTDPVSARPACPGSVCTRRKPTSTGPGPETVPDVKATLTSPFLLLQLQESAQARCATCSSNMRSVRREDLRPEEKAFLIRTFSVNWATMVRPYPRYMSAGQARARALRTGFGTDCTQFTAQEFLDLQVWFNSPGSARSGPSLSQLAAFRTKNRGFTEKTSRKCCRCSERRSHEIVPLYRALAERGQIELTTTPFYHPILPLVIDSETTHRARPDLPLPSRFRAPEDAEAQLRRAVDYHTATFGRPPPGLWPSEGSVCPELIPMLRRAGLSWLATDEGILADHVRLPTAVATGIGSLPALPYRSADAEVSIVVRDREISDAFGFVYHKTMPESASDESCAGSDRSTGRAADQVLIPIIWDGENPWEHYHDGGEQFLSCLYFAFSKGALITIAYRSHPHRLGRGGDAARSALSSCTPFRDQQTTKSGWTPRKT